MNRTDLEAFMQARGYTEDPSPQMKYSDFERELIAIFSQYFAPEWIEEHFLIPQDFKDYLLSLKGYLYQRDWATLADMEGILAITKSGLSLWKSDFEERKADGEPFTTDTLWAHIGHWSDKHEWIICLDRQHRHFGWVIDAYDDHPFLNEDFLTDDEWTSISEFISVKNNSETDDDDDDLS